jgi:hypothetical protein
MGMPGVPDDRGFRVSRQLSPHRNKTTSPDSNSCALIRAMVFQGELELVPGFLSLPELALT